MNKIIFVGTGSGYPSRNRACSSIIIDIDGRLFQLDAGEGFARSALNLNINYNLIEKIFISHLDPDHIVGIFQELQLMHLTRRDLSLEIFVPEEGVTGLAAACDLFYLFKEKFTFIWDIRAIGQSAITIDGIFSLRALPNRHMQRGERLIRQFGKPNKMQSYSFLIEAAAKKLLYSGDVESEEDILPYLGEVHTVIVDGFHADLRLLIEACAESKVERIIVTHINETNPPAINELAAITQKGGLRELIFAEDGLTVQV